MNKIGLNKKFRMGWNDYVRLMSLKHFPSLSCDLSHTTTMLMLIMTLMTLTFNTTKTFAQTFGTTYEAAANIDQLVGIDPSDEYLTETNTLPTENKKVLCFYNVGAKRFLSPGGYWGTHASLDNTAHAIWMKKSDNPKAFILVNNVAGSGTGTFLGNGTKDGYLDLYMDRGGSNDFVFEEAPGYNAKNKVYYVKMKHSNGKYYYVQAYPDDDTKYCNISLTQLTDKDDNYKNQEWKIITKEEYYSLLLANPANMEDVIDFSFIMKSPNFRVNDTDIKYWMAKGTDQIKYGDSQMYRPYKAGGLGDWVNKTEYQQKNFGKLFYSYAKGAKNFEFYQDIKVDKDGWYLLRCNGFTTQLNHNGKVSAHLMMAVVKNGSIDKTAGYSAATLNNLSVDAASKLMADDATGQGAGLAFFNGKYENQVQVCLDEKYLKDMGGSVTLRIGYYVGDDCELQDGDVTCVDNFKLLYAGPRRDPELILDEDQPSLVYLSNAKDVYKNSVLHLRRTFTEGKWNSLILPVDLKFGQMKRTFGDDVKVAKLTSLKDGVVTFTTVEPKQDNEVMVKAFEPYIIKPTSLTEDLGLAYTAEKFYTKLDETTGEISNAEWLAADGVRVSTNANDRFELHIPKNHYDIFMVTLNRDLLIKHLNFSEEDKTNYAAGAYDKINWENVSWESQTSFSTGANVGDLTCYGTLAKTYDDNGILKGRDDLHGDYVMRGGKIVQVPSDKKYGLKGFRCWFEVKGGSSQAKALRLEIDGISDDATSIDDINSQPSQFTSRHKGISGVFNLDGQKVREGESTQNLPKGIYIVNGRKVVVM
ncbi:MAG: hypothetical protein SPF96_04865 [Prevotella sp.]|nr:hypothetical protein [Prevotella sp.]